MRKFQELHYSTKGSHVGVCLIKNFLEILIASSLYIRVLVDVNLVGVGLHFLHFVKIKLAIKTSLR